jgi:hypothetical protein
MDQMNNNSFMQQRSRRANERIVFFQMVGDWRGGPEFFGLKPLVDEYESEAGQAMLEIEQPATPQEAANRRVIPEDRTG